MEALVSLKELARLVQSIKVADPYEQLEAKLTARYQRFPWQLVFDLLDMPDLGDRRPSMLMDSMLASLPDDCRPDRLFLTLFLHRLPAVIQDQFVAQDLKDAATIAVVTNRIYNAKPHNPGVHTVVPSQPALHAVHSHSPSPASRCYSGSHRDKNHRSQDCRREDDGQNGLCYYNSNFGAHAARLRPPCGWPGNGLTADGLGN
jgi:hypothetical protein